MYIHEEKTHNVSAANKILPRLIEKYNVQSILDIGTGIGTWLKVAKERNVSDILGVDGSWVNKLLLKIDESEFVEHDLATPLNLKRQFDLVICLEVAEHLTPLAAECIIETLTTHGRLVLFSAAIPEQGGQNHLNEKPHEYWADLFGKKGYFFYDAIRPVVWNDSEVDWWYRQNIFLVSNMALEFDTSIVNSNLYIHPERFYQEVALVACLRDEIKRNIENQRKLKWHLKMAIILFLNKFRGLTSRLKV